MGQFDYSRVVALRAVCGLERGLAPLGVPACRRRKKPHVCCLSVKSTRSFGFAAEGAAAGFGFGFAFGFAGEGAAVAGESEDSEERDEGLGRRRPLRGVASCCSNSEASPAAWYK